MAVLSMTSPLPCCPGKKNWLMALTLVLILLLCYYIWPLLDGLVLGFVFAYVGRPVRDRFRRSRRIGSLSALVCIVLPLSAIFAAGLIETSNQIQWLQGHQGEIISLLFGFVQWIRIPDLLLDEISRSMADLMAMGLNLLAGLPFFQVGSTIALGMINILIAFVVCYFLLLDGGRLAQAISPWHLSGPPPSPTWLRWDCVSKRANWLRWAVPARPDHLMFPTVPLRLLRPAATRRPLRSGRARRLRN